MQHACVAAMKHFTCIQTFYEEMKVRQRPIITYNAYVHGDSNGGLKMIITINSVAGTLDNSETLNSQNKPQTVHEHSTVL